MAGKKRVYKDDSISSIILAASTIESKTKIKIKSCSVWP